MTFWSQKNELLYSTAIHTYLYVIGSLVMRTRTLVFVVKPGVPTDDDAICSSPATTCNTQYLCNVLKYWKQEIGIAATNQAFCDALQLDLVQCQDLADKFR